MVRSHSFVGALAFLCTILSAGSATQSAQAVNVASPPQAAAQKSGPTSPPAVSQITQTINNSVRQQLVGNTDAAIVSGTDLGGLASDAQLDHLWLQLKRSPDREQALDQFIDQLHDPRSPNFHQWLTAAQFGALYGPAQQDIDTVIDWLQSQGFTVNSVYPSGMLIDFSGTAGTVQSAFGTQLHNYNVGGTAYLSNANDPSIPVALTPVVAGVVSLNNHFPHPLMQKRSDSATASGNGMAKLAAAVPAFDITIGTGNYLAVAPGDFNTIYNVGPVWAKGIHGEGQTIVVIEDTTIKNASDVTTFRNAFGLGASAGFTGTFSQINPTGATTCTSPGVNNAEGEAALDAEWAAVAAPNAAIELAACKDTTTVFGGLIASQNLINGASPPKIMSVSYGFCEASNGAAANNTYVSTWQQAAALGISVFVSSGDEGAASCDANATVATHGVAVSGFASTQYNVAVGGTDFLDTYNSLTGGLPTSTYWQAANTSTFSSALSYIPEIPWNDSCAGALLYTLEGFTQAYGATGFCNDTTHTPKGTSFRTTASGSGGPSNFSAKPTWQTGVVGVTTDGHRDIPDVSLFSANGLWNHFLVYCLTDAAQGGAAACDYTNATDVSNLAAGGTSFAAPALAGIQALINQSTGTSWGNMNPSYYALAGQEYGDSSFLSGCNSSKGNGVYGGCVFYDVTQGDIDVNCRGTTASSDCFGGVGTTVQGILSTATATNSPAYPAAQGWDFATGLGTVNVANLVTVMSTPSAPYRLAFTVEPSASYASEAAITVKVSVETFAGNVVASDTSAVTLSLSGGTAGANLSGTLTTNAVSGVATFSNIAVDKVGTGYALKAVDGSLFGAASSSFNITTGVPSAISFAVQPSNATAGVNIAPAIVVNVKDAGGNAISSDGITLAIANNPGNSTLSGGSSINTNASGNASFSGVSLNKSGAGYTLTATDSSASIAVTSTAFDISAGAASQLVFTTQPPAHTTFGGTFAASVSVEDNLGNVVTTNNSAVTIALTVPGGATLTGTTNVNAASGVANFSGISVDTAGSYSLTASDGALGSAVSNSFYVDVADQAINFTSTPPASPAVGDNYAVSATGGASGNPVTFSIDAASTPGACSIASALVSFTGPGNCIIDANEAGNTNYNAAPQMQQTVGIGQASQTITFPNPGAQTYSAGGMFALSATASSGLTVSYTSNTTGVCTVSGATATIVAAGACSITANQAGNANFSAAAPVTDNVNIGMATQTITFPNPGAQTYSAGGTFALGATASSGLTVSYTSNTTGVCTVSGATATIVAAGACSITANQSGNTNFSAAAPVTDNVNIGMATQTITFPNPGTQNYSSGASFALSATASSGLAVSYTSNTTGVCTVSGSTATIVTAGTCSITANQTGNTNFAAATSVTDDITISTATQSITFTSTAPTNGIINGPTYTVTAAASSNLPVTLTIDATSTSICSLNGSTSGSAVSFAGLGTCTIDADQAGDTNYSAAAQMQQSIQVVVGPAAQLVFTTQPLDVTAGDTLNAISVTEEDAFGNVIDDNSAVDFTSSACGGAVNVGNAMMINGVATLTSAERFYTVATGLSITANNGVLSGTSGNFSVLANAGLIFADGYDGCRP